MFCKATIILHDDSKVSCVFFLFNHFISVTTEINCVFNDLLVGAISEDHKLVSIILYFVLFSPCVKLSNVTLVFNNIFYIMDLLESLGVIYILSKASAESSSPISAMKIRKRIGPSTLPCGTPE